MQESNRWLDQKVKKSSEKKLATALELFISSKTVEVCNRDSHQAHNTGTGPVEETRVVKLVSHYGTMHAQKCIETY